ncbi:MAG: GDYXXLXY domain-containing protein [Bacteroidota bacterium]|nr:GDYXXLXY domain-containing protein [Bacteroidota bacterium]
MNKPLIAILFVLMCFSQWYVPGAMIAAEEDVLRNGAIFRFRTQPVDPSDPFRGKYITLSFRDDTFETGDADKWKLGEEVFVVVEPDEGGFARIVDLTDVKPAAGRDYLEVKVSYGSERHVRVDYPFDRFYLEESKAPGAERAYRDSNRDSTQVTYAVVRIKDGHSTLEDVMINDRSIVDIVREMNLE